jgi:uncharacterized protein (TIGR00369 family)
VVARKKTKGKEMNETLVPVMQLVEIRAFLERDFPQVFGPKTPFSVEETGSGKAVLKLNPDDSHLRPGGTVSGPTLFALADLTAFTVIIAHIGPVALAVTSSMNINFLRKPSPSPILGEGRILRLGKRNAVCEVWMRQASDGAMVAHATGTFAIPA